MSTRYISKLRNLARERTAWVFVSLILGAVALGQMYGMLRLYESHTTALVPYNIMDAKGPIKISSKGGYSPEYLTLLATADLPLKTNWTPANIQTQYARLLNRLDPDLFAQESARLLAEAKEVADKGSDSQVFHITKTSVLGENKVKLMGVLIRNKGEKQVFNSRFSFVIEYKRTQGIPMISSITKGEGDE